MDAGLRAFVRNRAGSCCEYCGLLQDFDVFLRFQIEHIIAKQHGGTDDAVNLALACQHCNLHKGPNLSGIDPDSGQVVALFNPRTQSWQEHFRMEGEWIVGTTPVGRATVRVLAMNAEAQRQLRAELS